MKLFTISLLAVCGLQLLGAGCKKESAQPSQPVQKVELVDSTGRVRAVVMPVSVGASVGTNGEVIPATAQIVSATLPNGEVVFPKSASVMESNPEQARSNGAVAAPAARKAQVVTSNGTNWFLGDTLVNGTNVGTNVTVRPR